MKPVVCLAPLVLLAVGMGCGHRRPPSAVSTAVSQNMAAALAQETTHAEQDGIPVRMAQLQTRQTPVQENAAPIYAELRRRLQAHPLGPQDQVAETITFSKYPFPPTAQLGQARQALTRRTDLMRLVHEAAVRPQCVFVRDWGNPEPANIVFPEMATVRRAARLLSAESLVLAQNGKPVTAVQNEAQGFQIARHAASDRTLIAYLLGNSIDAITVATLRKILYLSHGDSATARAVQAAIETHWKPRSLAAFLGSEVAFEQGELTWLRHAGPEGLNKEAGNALPKAAKTLSIAQTDPVAWNAFLDGNGVFLLRKMQQVIKAADRPYPEACSEVQTVETKMYQENPSHLLAVIFFPSVKGAVTQRARLQAQINETQAAAALLCWKDRHGAFPDTLKAALTPAPLDPFDGRPLRYRREGTGFVIYSVGPTGRFSGGVPGGKPSTGETAFRYPLPPAFQAAD